MCSKTQHVIKQLNWNSKIFLNHEKRRHRYNEWIFLAKFSEDKDQYTELEEVDKSRHMKTFIVIPTETTRIQTSWKRFSTKRWS